MHSHDMMKISEHANIRDFTSTQRNIIVILIIYANYA